jgi:hypothetical protein
MKKKMRKSQSDVGKASEKNDETEEPNTVDAVKR